MKLGEHAKDFWASYLRLGKNQKIFFGLFLIGCGAAGLYADSIIAPVDDSTPVPKDVKKSESASS